MSIEYAIMTFALWCALYRSSSAQIYHFGLALHLGMCRSATSALNLRLQWGHATRSSATANVGGGCSVETSRPALSAAASSRLYLRVGARVRVGVRVRVRVRVGVGLYLMNARKFSLSTRFLWTTLPSRFRWTSLGGRALGERPVEPCGSPRWPILLLAESKTLRGLATDCAWHG